MNNDLFRRYVWLVGLLDQSPMLSYEEISARWEESPFNTDGQPFPLRTFHNHRHAIARLFGIDIRCRRGPHNAYEIDYGDMEGLTRLRVWMLQTLASPGLETDFAAVSNRVVLDSVPTKALGLLTSIKAIATNRDVEMTVDNDRTVMEPYCIGFIDNEWLLAGRIPADGSLTAVSLGQVKDMRLLDERFVYPADFSPTGFFDSFRHHPRSDRHEAEQ